MTTMESPSAIPSVRSCYTPAYQHYQVPPSPTIPRMDGLSTSPNGFNPGNLQGESLPEKVFVGGLAEKTTEQDLRDIFQVHAPVKTVKIITDKSLTSKNGEPRRYAFIEFNSAEDASIVLAVYTPDSKTGEAQTIELHGRRLNIGSAFKKTQTFGKTFGPSISPMMGDPYQMYTSPYAQFMAPKSPMQPGMASPYYMPYGYSAHQSPYFQPMQCPPQSPTLPRQTMGFSNGAPLSPTGSPTSNPYACSPQLAYQLAQSMLQQMSMNQTPGSGSGQATGGGGSTDLDGSYLNSSSNSSSSRTGSSDRPTERFQQGPTSPLNQLPSGHSEQRERNGRTFSIPQPVRVNSSAQPSPYMGGPPNSPYENSPAGISSNSGNYMPRYQYVVPGMPH